MKSEGGAVEGGVHQDTFDQKMLQKVKKKAKKAEKKKIDELEKKVKMSLKVAMPRAAKT